MDEKTLEYAKRWFESNGHSVDISYGTLYLELEFFSFELSESEIENRAEQWLNKQRINKNN